MYQVVDAHGRVIELDDDEPVPPNCSLRVALPFMDGLDAVQRAVARDTANSNDEDPYEIDDELAERIFDARAAYKARISAGMHRHRVPTPVSDEDDVADSDDTDRRAAAYDAMKKRLSGAWKARRAPVPADPSWVSRVPWRPRGKYGNDAAPSDAEARRAGAYANFKARLHTAGLRCSPSPSAGDAASERRAHIERLQRAFFRER
jgi:hypothetical protein